MKDVLLFQYLSRYYYIYTALLKAIFSCLYLKIIFSPEWAVRVVLKRNESQIPFLYTLGHEMAHTERDICPLKHPKYCKFIAWTNEVHADLESGKIFLNRDKKKLLSAMLYICNTLKI